MNSFLVERFFKNGLGYVCLPILLALFFYRGSLGAYFNVLDLWEIRFTLYDYYGSFFPTWRPFRYALFYPVCLSFGLDPLPYRILFLIPYICLLVVLYLFYNYLTQNKALSIVAVVIFASFYLNAEVVTTLTFHHELLMTLFVSASLLSFCHYRKDHRLMYYALALLFAILAGLSKETATILPLFLLSVDYHVSQVSFPPRLPPLKEIGRALLTYLPFFLVLLVIALCANYGRGVVQISPYDYFVPGRRITVSQYLENIYWWGIYTLSPCFITDRLTIITAFSIIAGLVWTFYRSTPQKRSLIIAIVVCWVGSSIPYIPQGVVTRYIFLSTIFSMFLVTLLAFEIGLFLHKLLEKRLQGYQLSSDIATASLALLLLLPAIYLNHGHIKQFCQNVVYAGELTREVMEGTLRVLPDGPGEYEIIYINIPGHVISRRPHCVTLSELGFYLAALDLHYRQRGIKSMNEEINSTKALFLDLGYGHVKLASDAWYNIKTELEQVYHWMPEVSQEEYNALSKDERNKLLFFNPINNKLVDVSGWSYEQLYGIVTPYRDKLNYDPPNFLP